MRMIDNKLNRIKENFYVFFFIRWQIRSHDKEIRKSYANKFFINPTQILLHTIIQRVPSVPPPKIIREIAAPIEVFAKIGNSPMRTMSTTKKPIKVRSIDWSENLPP